MTPEAYLKLFKAMLDLEPIAIQAITGLIDKMKGMTPEQIAALTKTINNTAIAEIDAEEAKLPPVK